MSEERPHLILASGSAARVSMLSSAGVSFEKIPADIDEERILKQQEGTSDTTSITQKLATAKALHISERYPESLVIGSDQTLEFEGRILSKAKNRDDARAKLQSLRGKTHRLCSAVCIAQNKETIFQTTETADLTMHDFDDAFLETYMDADPDALTSCVGAYKIEGAGSWLFQSVKGDLYTIMGMPLLPLLAFLRTEYRWQP